MAENNPTVKLCACGCGRPAPLAVQTNNARNVKKGQPQTYIRGHQGRREVLTHYPKVHQGSGTELLHRVRAERALGHPLPPGAIVHHPDKDPENRNARLVILQDNAHHRLIHARMRIKAAGGNPNTDKMCGFCHRPKPLTEFYRGKYNYYCKPCHLLYIQTRRAARLAQQETSN